MYNLPLILDLAQPGVTDVRREMEKYGENPDQSYLAELSKRKENMQKRKGAFSFGQRFQKQG